jgi:basic amino acid/polyamine antiporter, APA family
MNLTEVTDLTSIGTLFAFVLVSAGVLILMGRRGGRYVPYVSARYIVPALYLGVWVYFLVFQRDDLARYFSFTDVVDGQTVSGWEVFKHEIPMLVYVVAAGVIAVFCFLKRLSLIPVMGVLTCGYLMTELGITNWIRFLLWLLAGLIIYFFYSYRHSNLHRREEGQPVG